MEPAARITRISEHALEVARASIRYGKTKGRSGLHGKSHLPAHAQFGLHADDNLAIGRCFASDALAL